MPAKKPRGEAPPPEDTLPVDVLPGVLVDVCLGSEDADDEALKKIEWPKVFAAPPMVGDFVQSLCFKHSGTILSRGHVMHETYGPIFVVTVRVDDIEG